MKNKPAAAKDGKKRVFAPTVWPLYIWTVLFVALPLVYVIALSFLKKDDVWGVTNEFTLNNYLSLFDPVYLKVFGQSFLVAVSTTALTLLVGYPFAYFTAKFSPAVRSLIILLLMAPFWVNSLLRLNGWIILLKANGPVNELLLGLGLIDEPLKLLYNNGAMMLGMVYALLPFMITSIYNSVEKLDWSVIEAARDLGASPAKAFLTVTVPLTVPGIVAGCVLVFVPSLALFFMADLLGGPSDLVIGNLVHDQLLKSRDWPFAAALSVVLLLITCVIMAIYRRLGGSSGDMTIF